MPPIYSNLPCGPPPSSQTHGSLRPDASMHFVSGRTQGRWRSHDAYLPGSIALTMRMRPEQTLRASTSSVSSGPFPQTRQSQTVASGSTAAYEKRPAVQHQQTDRDAASISSVGGAHHSGFSSATAAAYTGLSSAQSSLATSEAARHSRSRSTSAHVLGSGTVNVAPSSASYHPAGSTTSFSSSGVHTSAHAVHRRVSDGVVGLGSHTLHTSTTTTRYPDSTLLPSRPNLVMANAAVGAHVITTSGVRMGALSSSSSRYAHPSSTTNHVGSVQPGYHPGSSGVYGSGAAGNVAPVPCTGRLSGGLVGAGRSGAYGGVGHGHGVVDAGTQSRMLVGSRGYSRTSAWPVRNVQHTQSRTSIPSVDLRTLGITDEIIEATAARALLHWDATGQYNSDQMQHFVRTACTRMELDLLCLLTALLYTDRLRAKFPDAGASSCAKRVLTMGLMTATKYHKDNPYDNKSWARFCDVGLLTMNGMELQFLEALEFQLFINPDQITSLLDEIQAEQGVALHDAAQFVFDALTPRSSTPASPVSSKAPSALGTPNEHSDEAKCALQFAALSPVSSDLSSALSTPTDRFCYKESKVMQGPLDTRSLTVSRDTCGSIAGCDGAETAHVRRFRENNGGDTIDQSSAIPPCAESHNKSTTGIQRLCSTDSVLDHSNRTLKGDPMDIATAAELCVLADGAEGPVARVSFYTRETTAAVDGVFIAEGGWRLPNKAYKADTFVADCNVIRVPAMSLCVAPTW